MSTDLTDRLLNYRSTLDDAIETDIANRPPSDHQRPRRDRRVAVAACAALLLAAGIGALAWTNTDRPTSPTTPALTDQPATTITGDSIVAVIPEPSTAPSSEPTSSDVSTGGVRIARLALGDSVMLGAAPALAESGFTVDAVESRDFVNGLDTIEILNTQDRLGDIVVVHLGTNGTIDDDDMTQMMEALKDVPQVLLVTVDIPRDWTADNNSLIYDAAAAYPNVSLLDWAGLHDSCPGDCFYNDGFHLRPDGQAYYVNLINAAIENK
jgi:hydrogenase maturation factor